MFAADTTVDLLWRLLNGAMPLSVSVKQVVVLIGSNNLLREWHNVSVPYKQELLWFLHFVLHFAVQCVPIYHMPSQINIDDVESDWV